MSSYNAAVDVEYLLAFGLAHGICDPRDTDVIRNRLLDVLQLNEPAQQTWSELGEPVPDTATAILERLLGDLVNRGVFADTPAYRDLWDTRIMGQLLPLPSHIIDRFDRLENSSGAEAATNWFYDLNRKIDYIRVNRVIKNVEWAHNSVYGDLTITINISKPEKDPRDIAAALNTPASAYPACLLCKENQGYAGRLDHPARQTLRMIPITLNGERWHFQYSPYVYYNEHCIVLADHHTPMETTRATFQRLLDFVARFPHYFLGANAGLPVVGGSILNHDHFQGGRHTFPMEKAPIREKFHHADFPNVEVGIVNWPLSTIRLTGDPVSLVAISEYILCTWRGYTDSEVGVLANTSAPHNAITPIARRVGQRYQMDLVLRNNRTDEQYPLGIFHPHPQRHHIKKENIGLIEAMGLMVLPGRLKTELARLSEVLQGLARRDDSDPLQKPHGVMLDALQGEDWLSADEAETALCKMVGDICVDVLRDAGVFKDDGDGRHAFRRFMQSAGFGQL